MFLDFRWHRFFYRQNVYKEGIKKYAKKIMEENSL